MAIIVEIKNGKSNTEDAVDCGKFIFFDRSKKIKKSNRYLFDGEYVIVPGEGQDFIPTYANSKFDLHQRAYAIKSTDTNILLNKYLFYFIFKYKYLFNKYAVGSTVPSLRISSFDWILKTSFVCLNDQQKIIDIIEQNEKLFLKHSNCVRIDNLEHVQKDMKSLIDIIEPFEKQKSQLIKLVNFFNLFIANLPEKVNGFTFSQVAIRIKEKPKSILQASAKVLGKRNPLILNQEDIGTYKTNNYYAPEETLLINSIRPYLEKFGILPFETDYNGTLIALKIEKDKELVVLHNLLTSKFWKQINNLSKGTKMPVVSFQDVYEKIEMKEISLSHLLDSLNIFHLYALINKILLLLDSIISKLIDLLIK